MKEALESESGSQLYGKQKNDVEPFFGRMKRNFGVHRVHVRGKIGIRNDLGLLLLSMNLTKLARKVRGVGVQFKEKSHIFFIKNKGTKRLIDFSSRFVPLFETFPSISYFFILLKFHSPHILL